MMASVESKLGCGVLVGSAILDDVFLSSSIEEMSKEAV
jgi:hypothetical protein